MLRLVITGRPGVGKSTLFNSIVDELRKAGYTVGGIIAPEVRLGGQRVGFKLVDLLTGEETWLARKDVISTVRVGSYGVLVRESSQLVEKALTAAMEKASVIGIDEVGPMELKLSTFKSLLLKVLDSRKHVILVVHMKLGDEDILSRLKYARKIVLTLENRENYRKTLPKEVLEFIKRSL